MTFTLVLAGAAEGYIMKQDTVVSDIGRLADYQAGAVVNEKPLPDFRPGVNLQTGQQADDLGKQARKKWDTKIPEKMIYPVRKDGVKSGIKQKLYIPRRRVIAIDRFNVFNDS